MIRSILALLLLINAEVSYSESFISGKWQAYEKDRLGYKSAILEADDSGNGFFAYTLGEGFNPELVLKVSPETAKYNKRFGFHEFDKEKGYTHRLLLARDDLNYQIVAIVYVEGLDKSLEFSQTWILRRVVNRVIDTELYEFAKKNL